MNDTELIAHEIGYFIRPRNKRRELAEAVIGGLAIVAFIAFLIWFASL